MVRQVARVRGFGRSTLCAASVGATACGDAARSSKVKMAPRKKSVRSPRASLSSVFDKENSYLRGWSDYQTRVRRRDTIRNGRTRAVSRSQICLITVAFFIDAPLLVAHKAVFCFFLLLLANQWVFGKWNARKMYEPFIIFDNSGRHTGSIVSHMRSAKHEVTLYLESRKNFRASTDRVRNRRTTCFRIVSIEFILLFT